jgi:two-component system OmpR family sensor kinase
MSAPPRIRVVPRTLRGRLIAGLLTLLIAACAAVGLVTYLAVRDSLSGAINSDLQTATNLAYECSPGAGRPHQGGGPIGPAPTGVPPKDGNPIPHGCQGLAEGTYVAFLSPTHGFATLVGNTSYKLSAADEKALRSIPSFKATGLGTASPGSSPAIPTTTRDLTDAGGTFLLTAVTAPGGNGAVDITGLPLSTLHNTLRKVALTEAAVFAGVLLLAGTGGTLWVRFSLRPLRRVAATASQVAELPLDSDEVELPAGVPDTDPATETGQVGLAFNRMLGHVQTALRRRAASEARLRRFAADASHELRTPLSAIRGYAELALRRPGDSPEQVTHALGRVLSESTRMSVLVDELLLLARLDAGRPLASEPVDMTRLVIDATSDAQVARPSHRWVLELPDDPVLVSGDEHRLHQVLANVLSNAGKHTPDGATVTVRVGDALPSVEATGALGAPGGAGAAGSAGAGAAGVGAAGAAGAGGGTGSAGAGAGAAGVGAAGAAPTVRRGELPPPPRLVVSVTDNGPGIPPDLLPDLFERFTRADTARSRTTSASSTGLGLAIVDAVVAAHGGAVLVTSRPGQTSFAIALPRLTEPAGPPAPAPAQQRRPQPTRKR